jgi:hypothetical protein
VHWPLGLEPNRLFRLVIPVERPGRNAFCPDRIDTRIRPSPACHVQQSLEDVRGFKVHDFGPALVFAIARRSGTLSIAITRFAPSIHALAIAI